MRFLDRRDAGRQLAMRLEQYRAEEPIVLALPRGGVVVGYEVAEALSAPLDVLVVRKLGAPGFPELAVGAVAEGGATYVEAHRAQWLGITEREMQGLVARETAELQRRVERYRGTRPFPDVRGRTVIVVDDGIATGSTAWAAVRALRPADPQRLVVAAPVVAPESVEALRGEVDDVVFVHAPDDFLAVGTWYDTFSQVSDDDVLEWLERARASEERREKRASHPGSRSSGRTDPSGERAGERVEEALVQAGSLEGDLGLPADARAIVLFAHGSGSGRRSPRNRLVARTLREAGLATLLVDLLTADEAAEDEWSGRFRFDVGLLARRVLEATGWLQENPTTSGLSVGYFGASTGAAAALVAAAELPHVVGAIVSRGGRPDLADERVLRMVRAPGLFIVGGRDEAVLEANRAAVRCLGAEAKLVVVPGATHLFEERGALEAVARLAAGWFGSHLLGRREQDVAGAP